ncbi:MAG: type II toxin-antitoxin system RelE/ParE family toxin [Anaerolineaceae bacterium]|nr:type II toxin-antitoxin system RelE/ParE family toxin [Anaerolineaceae bacterium]
MARQKIWEVFLTKPAEKNYDRVTNELREQFDLCFASLEDNPLFGTNIRPLTGSLKGLFRYRTGDWRIIYRPQEDRSIVEIIAILPRGDAYKK